MGRIRLEDYLPGKEAINTHLFNEAASLYQHTDSRPDVFLLDANMNAVKTGVAPPDKVQYILDYFKAAWVEHGSEISQPVDIGWAQNTENSMFHLEITAPEGTGDEVWVPVGSATEAAGVALTRGATLLRRDGEYDAYSVGEGTHEFLIVNFESLEDLVSSFSSKPGVANALTAKLDAVASASKAHTRANILGAFINQVNAQAGGTLTSDQADLLILLA